MHYCPKYGTIKKKPKEDVTMTGEEKVVDLLAEGISTFPQLKEAMEQDGFDSALLQSILSDLTEQDFAEIRAELAADQGNEIAEIVF